MLDRMELIDAEIMFYGLIEDIPIIRDFLIPDPITEQERREEQLRRREASIEQRLAELEQRRQVLEEERTELQDRQEAVSALEEEMEERERALAQRQERFETDEDRAVYLADLYQGMPPAEAAARLEEVEEDTVLIAVIQEMEQMNASVILSEMDPERVAVVTRKLANFP